MEQLRPILENFKWIYAIGLALVAGGISFYFQDSNEIELKKIQINSLKQRIAVHEIKIKDYVGAEKEFSVKKKELESTKRKLLLEKGGLQTRFDIPVLLNAILNEAKQIGLVVKLIVPEPREKKHELYSSLRIRFSAEGTFLQFFIFVDRLSRLREVVSMTDFSLQAERKKRITLRMSKALLDKRLKVIKINMSLLVYRVFGEDEYKNN